MSDPAATTLDDADMAAHSAKMQLEALHLIVMSVRVDEHRLAEMRYRLACKRMGVEPMGSE